MVKQVRSPWRWLIHGRGRLFTSRPSPGPVAISAAACALCVYLLVTSWSTPVRPVMTADWTELPDPPDLTFRDKYFLWDRLHPPAMGDDQWARSDSYLIYRCDPGRMDRCGGLADRLKGMLLAYVMANLTRRAFRVEVMKPSCGFQFYLTPNVYDWSVEDEATLPPPDSGNIVRLVNDHYFRDNIARIHFEEYISPSVREIYFQANLEYMGELRRTRVYHEELSWMEGLSPADIYAALYKRLFRLAPRLQTQLRQLLSKHLNSTRSRLVCTHVRLGRNPSIQGDTEIRNSLRNVKTYLWPFLQSQLLSETDSLFIMTDSAQVDESARQQPFAHRLVAIPGTIAHIDMARGLSFEEMCQAQDRLMLEFHLLMTCDLVVKSASGISEFASFIRGSDRGLYCFHKNGTIFPCQRNRFSNFS
ncbi:uncharacterized protein LOC101862129 [Aplysia californica]|uniref:Uncharacterized protein LOC101862129 n=1 Tax=Aplysia californica TaxID=6500 RepID=A0ABM0JX09_APLCA|nr:uncharacterized protein LOC101862129 [Aplysia californica]